jgi:hypothetical protein
MQLSETIKLYPTKTQKELISFAMGEYISTDVPFAALCIMQMTEPTNVPVVSTRIGTFLEPETYVTQLSLLVTDKLPKELYVLP